jgi:hypothetical protein
VSARTASAPRLSAALVLLGYLGSCGVSSAAPATSHPETEAAARTRADLTRNREALRKVITAEAHGTAGKHPAAVSHGARASSNAAATHGAPAGPNASEAHGPLAAGAIPQRAMVTPKSGAIGAMPASLNRPRMAPAAGTLGGSLASNTLTPGHHSPAAPVTLGGAPVRRNVSYGVIDGNAFHHKP